KLFVHRLEGEEGKKVSFDQVLLIDTGSKVSVGDPVVKGAAVSARILAHVKSDKVLVFKKKRKKGYQKLNGHRQYMTQIQIETISEKAAASKAEDSPQAEAAPKAAAAPVKKEAITSKQPAAGKTAEEQKPATTKKTAVSKTTAAKKAPVKPAPKKKPGEDKEAK
ncbi:MAG: 50S ribosomal protein L21, partial [Bacteroidota bacterium]